MLERWQFVESHILNVQAELFSDFVAFMLMHKHFHSCHSLYLIFFPDCFKVMSHFFCLPQGCFVWTSGSNQVTVLGNFDVKVAGVTIHMYLEELAALSEVSTCALQWGAVHFSSLLMVFPYFLRSKLLVAEGSSAQVGTADESIITSL